MKRTSIVMVVVLLHAGCAHPDPVQVHPFPPDGSAIPILPPELKMPPWWPQGVPPPVKAPAWMTYPDTWREA